MEEKSKNKKKSQFITSAIILLLLLLAFFGKLAFYTPPLLDSGGRNIAEKITDFLYFSWHFTKASIYKDILKNKNKAEKDAEKAAWYDRKYLVKKFNLNGESPTEALKVYGENLITWNKWKTAASAFSKAVELDPGDSLSYYYLGFCHFNLKKFDSAKQSFKKATALKPDFADAYYHLGLIAENEKDLDKAKALFEKAISLLPNHIDSLTALQRIAENIH